MQISITMHICLQEVMNSSIMHVSIRELQREYFDVLSNIPGAASTTSPAWLWLGGTPLHCMCYNKNATLGMVKLLIDAAPESVQRQDKIGQMPLHELCCNKDLDDEGAVDILKLLVMKYPEAIQHFAGISRGN